MSSKNKVNNSLIQHFFNYDYHDRDMLKWQGFFLSDHTAALNKKKIKPLKLRSQQNLKFIDQKLLIAWKTQNLVIIQLSFLFNNYPIEISGLVKGYYAKKIILKEKNKYKLIDLLYIQNVQNI
mgnify:CR=1 FL=1